MNNKAFTLVELLGVIVIITLVLMLVSPMVVNIVKDSKSTIYQAQINNILKSAYDFSLQDLSHLPSTTESKYITLGELKINGLVDANIIDPNTNEKFPDNLVISVRNVGIGYKYNKNTSILEGNYLYTLEFDKLNNTNLLPTLVLDGLTNNSNGNYIITLDLNEEFDDINYTATSKDSVDLTGRVKTYITNNNITVDSIDTSNRGIYKINYIVVDDDGYSNAIVLNVIVADNTKPEIILPKINTISSSVSSMDLLNGVSCTDNSGFCDITLSGTINYGIEGKYIIEYTAIDPSGNTNIQKRVITIE